MRDAEAELAARELEVVVVGSGTPEHARDFAADLGGSFSLRVDPELDSFRAAGLRRGPAAVFSPRTLLHAGRALRRGFRQGATQGDPWQNGGVFVIDTRGWVLFRHTSREAGDHAVLAEVLAACDRSG